MLESKRGFFSRFSPLLLDQDTGDDSSQYLTDGSNQSLLRTNPMCKYMSEFIIETFCFAEDFKQAWFDFFSEEFYENVDRGDFDL